MKTLQKPLLFIVVLLVFGQMAWAQGTVDTESALRTAVQSNQTVTLGTDITLSNGRLNIDGTTVTLNLNGHKLTRPMTAADAGGQVIAIMNSGKLTITDSGTGGQITGGWAHQGGGIYVYEGCELTINGGTITGNRADQIAGGGYGYGGGVENHGTLTISGGTITSNTAGQFGGGIHNEGTLTITGGSIADNTAGTYGGAIYNNSTVNISSFSSSITISGNSAQTGGGIYMTADGATLKMRDKPVVQDNTSDDVYLSSYQLITIVGSLSPGASIGVMTEVEQDNFTSGYYASMNSADPSTYFHVSSSRFAGTIGWNSGNNEAKLTKTGYKYIDHTWTQSTKTLTAEEKTKANGEYSLLESSSSDWKELTNGGWFVVDGNINIPALKVTGTSNLILCDGASITVTEGVKVEMNSNAVINIYG